jgi:hypothetical protein
MAENQGTKTEEIQKLKAEFTKQGKPFKYVDEEEASGEMAEFFFIGNYDGKEVVFDCLLGTLRLAYESNLLEMAESRTKDKFPDYKGFDFEIDDQGNAIGEDHEESEEIEAYKAFAMYEIEEAGEANVAESVSYDESFEYGIGMEAYLNIPEITEETIIQFISDINSGNLKLDPVRYSFETEDDEEED